MDFMFFSTLLFGAVLSLFAISGIEAIPATFAHAINGDSNSIILLFCILLTVCVAVVTGYKTARCGKHNIILPLGIISVLLFLLVVILMQNSVRATQNISLRTISALPESIVYSFIPVMACTLSTLVGKITHWIVER